MFFDIPLSKVDQILKLRCIDNVWVLFGVWPKLDLDLKNTPQVRTPIQTSFLFWEKIRTVYQCFNSFRKKKITPKSFLFTLGSLKVVDNPRYEVCVKLWNGESLKLRFIAFDEGYHPRVELCRLQTLIRSYFTAYSQKVSHWSVAALMSN